MFRFVMFLLFTALFVSLPFNLVFPQAVKNETFALTSFDRVDYWGAQKLDPARMQMFGFEYIAKGVWRGFADAYDDNDQRMPPVMVEIYDYADRFDINNDGSSNIADLTLTVDFIFRNLEYWKR